MHKWATSSQRMSAVRGARRGAGSSRRGQSRRDGAGRRQASVVGEKVVRALAEGDGSV
jgi:hypothetical protein